MRRLLTGLALAAILASVHAPSATAAGKKLIVGTPGIPPIFAATLPIVADKMGFFKKYGADVEVKFMESGTTAARALISGDVDIAMAPTPQVTAQASNAGVPYVGIFGLPHPDFLLASTDPKKATCKNVIGQSIGVDVINGARVIALRLMLAPCGVKLDQVKQVALPSTATQQALISGSLTYGVLHMDEIPVLEEHGKPITEITSIRKASPNSHMVLFTARSDHLKADRDAYVRFVAGLVAAARWMKDPMNADKFADIATVTGRTKAEAKSALGKLEAIDYWPTDSDGMERKQIEGVIAGQVKTGNIQPGKTPVAYDKLIDTSIYKDAAALIAKTK
jgi:ABC-type nitrate/sulfonate/bicarbonate transport system substrate-binding protein